MVLSVRNRIQFGIGRFCLALRPRIFFTLRDLCDGCKRARPAAQSAHRHRCESAHGQDGNGWERRLRVRGMS